MNDGIRLATASDSDACQAIYAPYVRDTMISLEIDVPTREEYRTRIEDILASGYPFLVYEKDGAVTGFAYASRMMNREGYKYNASLSVYLSENARGAGLGRKLYACILELLREQGYCNGFAVITLPNAASVGLQKAFGFREIGVHKRTGYKFGRWCDVLWMEKDLGAPDNPPALRRVEEVPAEVLARCLAGAEKP